MMCVQTQGKLCRSVWKGLVLGTLLTTFLILLYSYAAPPLSLSSTEDPTSFQCHQPSPPESPVPTSNSTAKSKLHCLPHHNLMFLKTHKTGCDMEGVGVVSMGVLVVLVLLLSWITNLAGQDAPPNTVFYQCNRTSVSVAVKSDPLNNGVLLDPGSLTLGKCPVSSTTALQGFLVFEYRLYDCRFSRMVLGNAVKFFTDLVYKPAADVATNVLSPSFQKQINCISDISMTPTPIETTVVVQVSGTGQLDFSSLIMNDDFTKPSDIKEFLLGSPIFLAIFVRMANHMPLQIFVDECIAAPTNDLRNSGERYALINNHGCFVDGKVAASRFVEPLQLDTIRLTFPAMTFVGPSNEIYLHFKLIVWEPKTAIGLKACSYLSDINRWQLLGNPQSDLCRCCDSICRLSSRRRRDAADENIPVIHTMVLGPFKIHSPPINGTLNARNESKALESLSAFPIPPAAGALFLELAVLLLLSLGVAVYGRAANRDCKELEKHLLVTHEN
ncbi:galactosylceramide sulfotransferase isoform X2 [Rhinoderma darwinii]